MKNFFPRSTVLYLLPLLVVAWTLFLRAYAGPFYLSSIDPEYIYLISGLNCATLDFRMIGHIDHPGTPFQLLTGLFFHLIHLFHGSQDLRTDVISDPEHYLVLSNLMLAILTFVLLLFLGKLAYRHTSSILGALVLQAAPFYTLVNAGILARYSPDRFMTVILLLFFMVYLQYRFKPTFGAKKFALYSGLIMGAGLMTKFNFAPLLLIPLILLPNWKRRGTYLLALLGSAVLLFLPVSSKYRKFWDIISGLITHKGLYGSGEKGLLDTTRFMDHIVEIFSSHPSFTLITLLSLIALGVSVFGPNLRKKNREEFLFLAASLTAIAAGLVMTAKHYKGYYALPVLSLIPLMLFSLLRIMDGISRIRNPRLISTGLFVLLLVFPLISLVRHYTVPNEDLRAKQLDREVIQREIGPEDHVLIIPNWKSTAMIENAMVLGVSYFHHRWRFAELFERVYPRVLTWEGTEAPIQHMRMRDANLREIWNNETELYLYATPDLNAEQVCSSLEHRAADAGIGITRDTVYTSLHTGAHLIRYRNPEETPEYVYHHH